MLTAPVAACDVAAAIASDGVNPGDPAAKRRARQGLDFLEHPQGGRGGHLTGERADRHFGGANSADRDAVGPSAAIAQGLIGDRYCIDMARVQHRAAKLHIVAQGREFEVHEPLKIVERQRAERVEIFGDKTEANGRKGGDRQ